MNIIKSEFDNLIDVIMNRKSVRQYTDRAALVILAGLLPYAKMAVKAFAVCGDLSKAYYGLDDEYKIQDCSAATENLLMATKAMGLTEIFTRLSDG